MRKLLFVRDLSTYLKLFFVFYIFGVLEIDLNKLMLFIISFNLLNIINVIRF